MAEAERTTSNAGDFAANARELPITIEAQFRNVNQRLDDLATQVSKISKPTRFRTADVVTLVTVVIGLIGAIFTGLGLSERLTDLRSSMSDTETRLSASISQSETRLQSRLEKLESKFQDLDERAAHLEGADTAKPTGTAKPNSN